LQDLSDGLLCGHFLFNFLRKGNALLTIEEKARDIMAEELVICPGCGLEVRLSKIEEHMGVEKLEKEIIKEFQQFFRSESKEIQS
jgi:hypothetical protein